MSCLKGDDAVSRGERRKRKGRQKRRTKAAGRIADKIPTFRTFIDYIYTYKARLFATFGPKGREENSARNSGLVLHIVIM